MYSAENKHKASCKFSLGLDYLSTHDLQSSEEFRNKHSFAKETIYCLESGNTVQTCTISDKINEFKERIGEFYFDKDETVIAIPNQIELSKYPRILEVTGTKEENSKYLDEFYESKLHNQIIIAVRNLNLHAFVLKGFQSEDCFKAKLEKGKQCRKKDQCAGINHHERDVMVTLDINDISKEDLETCVNLHKQMKSRKLTKKEIESSWLFKQVNVILFISNIDILS